MIYKSNNMEFKKAFDAVRYAMQTGQKVGIYKGDKFLRWLV